MELEGFLLSLAADDGGCLSVILLDKSYKLLLGLNICAIFELNREHNIIRYGLKDILKGAKVPLIAFLKMVPLSLREMNG